MLIFKSIFFFSEIEVTKKYIEYLLEKYGFLARRWLLFLAAWRSGESLEPKVRIRMLCRCLSLLLGVQPILY